MADPPSADVCKTAAGSTQTNTVQVCLFCECQLRKLEDEKKLESTLKHGSSDALMKDLHEHLKRFGFVIELSTSKSGKPVDSADLKGKWGDYTARAVRMFALHPQVAAETASVVSGADGSKMTSAIAEKMRVWCRAGTVSPKDYWAYQALDLKAGDLDAFGADKKGETNKQTTLHDFVKQVQDDLAKIGFGVHDDSLCEIGKAHVASGEFTTVKATSGRHLDQGLKDMGHLIARWKRQTTWAWRMNKDGSHADDAKANDGTTIQGAADESFDFAAAQVLHAWSTRDLHMVVKKFELKDLHWPADDGAAIQNEGGASAKLRSDAHDAWSAAAKEIAAKGGTLEGPYASSPRKWTSGKLSSASANSPYSWHYSGLAVDIGEQFYASDGSVSAKFRYVLEVDGTKFRVHCYADPQPDAPADLASDKTDPLLQYRNRNIKAKVPEGSTKLKKDEKLPADAAPLFGATTTTNGAGNGVVSVTAKEGWYVDLSAILESHQLNRIPRHGNWLTKPKAWEWWHYQFKPGPPPGASGDLTFGDLLQLYGVHEYRLRNVGDGWPAHEDIDHTPG